MKIHALVTALVLGSSSLALAAPGYTAPAARDHRQPAPVYAYGWHEPVLRPVLLANDTRLDGRALINVSSAMRMFTRLELKAQNGRTNIERVLITFANGQRQYVPLTGKQQGILRANKSVTIDLDGGARNIKSVMLIGSSGRRATFDVLAV